MNQFLVYSISALSKEAKLKIRKIAALILAFIGFFITGSLAHEAGHLTINNLLGGKGEIHYDYAWISGHMDWITVPQENIWMVYVGGGILAAIFMLLFFWLPARLTPSKQDVYIEGAAAAIILNNLLYAPVELILYYRGERLFEWAWITAYILTAGIFFTFYVKTLFKWIDKRFNNWNNNHSQ